MIKNLSFFYFVFIVLSVFFSYWPAFNAGLVFDDEVAIKKNPDIYLQKSLIEVFKNDFWGLPLKSNLSHKSYRPLTILSFKINYFFHQFNSFGYHLINLVLHSIASLLVYRLSTKILHSNFNAFLSGLLFSVHPIHSDAVISIVGRAELLSSAFFLFGLIAVTKDKSLKIKKKKLHLGFAIICSYLGFLSKEQSIILLPIIIFFLILENTQLYSKKFTFLYSLFLVIQEITSFFFNNQIQIFNNQLLHNHQLKILKIKQNKLTNQLKKINSKKNLRKKIIWFLIVSFSIAIYLRIKSHGYIIFAKFSILDQIPVNYKNEPLSALLTFIYVIFLNVWLFFYPNQLACDWSFGSIKPISHLKDHRNIFSLLFLTSFLFILMKLCFMKQTYQTQLQIKLFLSTFILLSPALFLKTGFILAERVLYLPSIFFIILIILSYENLYLKYVQGKKLIHFFLRYLIGFCIFLMFSSMVIKCQVRSLDWQTEKSLVQSTLLIHPKNVKMLVNMGRLLDKNEKIDTAISYYEKAIKIHKGYLRPYSLLAEVLCKKNLTEKAMQILDKAKQQIVLSLNTNDQIPQESIKILIRLEQLLQLHHVNYNNSLQKIIISLYQKINDLSFLKPEEVFNLALILKENNQNKHSINLLKTLNKKSYFPSIKLYNELVKPQHAINHFRIAMQLANSLIKPIDKILFHLKQSVFYDPNFIQAYYNLALLFYKQNKLHQTRYYLFKVLKFQQNHFKSNLLLCDLEIEIDQNYFKAINCYRHLLSISNLDLKIKSLTKHNLCSVLKHINSNFNYKNFTIDSYFCTDKYFKEISNNLMKFQVSINKSSITYF